MEGLDQVKTFQPAVKWSGSKRHLAEEIIRRFPSKIDTYYEPFCGGASVLRRLIDTNAIKVNRYVCSDLNDGLIGLWNEIKDNPDHLLEYYEDLWNELNGDDDLERKKRYFESVRRRFNSKGDEYHNPGDFLFIMRTCTNGMPRYNANGEFNNSFHVTRNGIEPHRLRPIINDWCTALNRANVEFVCRSYEEIEPKDGDFMFLDPPYNGTKGMYFGSFDVGQFFIWLGGIRCPFALTFDGKAGDADMTYDVPRELYDRHEYLESGNSSFRRVIGKSRNTTVYESLYTRGCSNCFRLGL